tara:strand:- start:1988 stop:2113 length:126 start_codon:yes stop_codon:yes gene_type:complete
MVIEFSVRTKLKGKNDNVYHLDGQVLFALFADVPQITSTEL